MNKSSVNNAKAEVKEWALGYYLRLDTDVFIESEYLLK